MMYKQKKISKFALICCSFLIALSTMLAVNPSWLSNVYDTTLCASSSAPTIDSTYFDYTNTSLYSSFDWSYDNRFYNGTSTMYAKFMKISSDFVAFNNTTLTGRYYGPQYPISSMTFTANFDYSYYDFSCTLKSTASSITTVDHFIFSSLDSAKQSILSNYDWIGYVNISDTYYIICSDSLYDKYLSYSEGLADADTDTAFQNGVTQGQNNVLNNPNDYDLYTESQYNQNYTNGYNAGVAQGQNNVLNNPSQFGLYTQSQYEQNYTNGYNDGINNVVSNPSQYNLYTQSQYDQNYQAGVESTTNYQDGLANGIVQGQNNVLNNPSQFGLYTQSQYEQNYTNGYEFATNLAKYGFTFQSQLYVQLTDQAELVPISYEYYENGIKLTQESIDYIVNNFIVSNNRINFKLVAKYDLNILYPTFNFFENGVSQNTIDTFYGSVKDIDGPIQSLVMMTYNYNSVNRDGIVTGNNVADFNPASYRGGEWTGTVSQQRLNTDLYNVTLQNYDSTHNYYTYNAIEFGFDFNADDLPRLFIRDYNQSYINGYEDGRTMINSNAYNEGYDIGYNAAYNLSYSNAYNEGKSDGINSANQYSFYSLISSVVDAPLNMFKSMFNFEFLGINLFNFFTSIFTLCLVIFIISKFLKK